jgi:hypothetical protein
VSRSSKPLRFLPADSVRSLALGRHAVAERPISRSVFDEYAELTRAAPYIWRIEHTDVPRLCRSHVSDALSGAVLVEFRAQVVGIRMVQIIEDLQGVPPGLARVLKVADGFVVVAQVSQILGP